MRRLIPCFLVTAALMLGCSSGWAQTIWGTASTGAATAQSVVASPTGSAAGFASRVMMGLAGAITPKAPNVLLIISGDVANSVGGSGANIQIRYGTGTAPTNGTNALTGCAGAACGTACGRITSDTITTAALKVPFSIQCVAQAVTPGTALWYDVSLNAVTSGTAVVTDLSLSAIDVQ